MGAYVELPSGERLGVVRAAFAAADDIAPGELAARDDRLLYGASPGALELLEVQPAGKRAMATAEWLRGHRWLLAVAQGGATPDLSASPLSTVSASVMPVAGTAR